uniref:Uncharacterized protein n=1 Tax=Oncorhynchus mykiss TaxID=8022 RepID=A0A8C7LV33_ONCMY
MSCVPQFMLYTCPLSSVSFCAILPTPPKVFGFVFKHPAADTTFVSTYHLLVFLIADAFRRERSLRGERRDLTVEALSHKIRLKRLILQRENVELRMRLNASGDVNEEAVGLHTHTHNSVPFKIVFSLTSKPNPNPYFSPNPNLNPKP